MVQLAAPENFPYHPDQARFTSEPLPPTTPEPQSTLSAAHGPQGPQTTPSQYPSEGENFSEPTAPTVETPAPMSAIPPSPWEPGSDSVVISEQDPTKRAYQTVALAHAALDPVRPTPEQITRYLQASMLTNLNPVMSVELWFKIDALYLWYEEVAKIPFDAIAAERELLDIRKLCQQGMSYSANPNRLSMLELIKVNADKLHTNYQKRLKHDRVLKHRKELNRKAQQMFQIRKKKLGAQDKDELARLDLLEQEWKEAVRQRNEAVAQWNNYVKEKRDVYRHQKDLFHNMLADRVGDEGPVEEA